MSKKAKDNPFLIIAGVIGVVALIWFMSQSKGIDYDEITLGCSEDVFLDEAVLGLDEPFRTEFKNSIKEEIGFGNDDCTDFGGDLLFIPSGEIPTSIIDDLLTQISAINDNFGFDNLACQSICINNPNKDATFGGV